MIKKLYLESLHSTTDAQAMNDIVFQRGVGQLVFRVNQHLLIVRHDCPVCCIFLMLDSILCAILSTDLTAYERLFALRAGNLLIDFQSELNHREHPIPRAIDEVVIQLIAGLEYLESWQTAD
jgi:hypothetical protein